MFHHLENFSVLGLPLHLSDNYSQWLLSRITQKIGTHIVTLNAEMVMMSEQNPALANIIHQADLVIPDGSGIIFYLWLRRRKANRCPGIELAELLIKLAGQSASCPIFFYGGKPHVVEKTAQFWQKQIPNLAIAGFQHGYIKGEEEWRLKETLKQLQPGLILVGLGVPRQEMWISENRHLCPNSIWIGVGGSLDIWSGEKNRAPAWLRNNSLEWLYRLYQEPWRWKRMLVLPQFAFRALISN